MDRYVVTMQNTVRLDMVIKANDEFEAAQKLRDYLPPTITNAEPGWSETGWHVTDSVRQLDRV